MTQTPTNVTAATDASAEMLALARKATARIITAALEATAESADIERTEQLRRQNQKFPALSSLPPALQLDPQQIRDFTKSPAYADLIEQYVQGRIEGHLLTRVLELANQYLPSLLVRLPA